MSDVSALVAHVIDGAAENPRMARGLREIIVTAMGNHEVGSEAHSHLLETLQSLDRYIAEEGRGYSKEAVMKPKGGA